MSKNESEEKELPTGPYLIILVIFNLLFAGLFRKSTRMDSRDLILVGVATHKLSRVITKDAVTSPIRAPFARYQEDLGYGEVNETARGSGLRASIGELLTCNYC